MLPFTQCQSLRPLRVRRALTSSNAEAAVHPAAFPGHLMTLAGREAPEAQEPTHTVQGSALAVSVTHALDGVAGSECHEVIPGSTLQEALVADLPRAGEPGCQEGAPSGS